MRQLFLLILLAATLQISAQDDFLIARQIKTIELKLISGANECYKGITSGWFRGKCRMDYKLGESLYCNLENWGDTLFRYHFAFADSVNITRGNELLRLWHYRIYKSLSNSYNFYPGDNSVDSSGITIVSAGVCEYIINDVRALLLASPFRAKGVWLCRVEFTMQNINRAGRRIQAFTPFVSF